MNIIYFGSSDFSVPFLERLDSSKHTVSGVFTYADKKKGRGLKKSTNPVKAYADSRDLDVFEVKLFDEDFYSRLSTISFDYAIVVSFGMILPEEIFKRWPDMWLNVHPSMLPAYRGPSPMISALLDGAKKTGVTINGVVYEVDTGKVYAQTAFNIEDDDNLDSIEKKPVSFGAPLLITVLDTISEYGYKPAPQAREGVTYTRKITPEDLKIDWLRPAVEIFNRIRAFSSRPGAYTFYKGSRLKILSSSLTSEIQKEMKPGTVAAADKARGLLVVCGDGMLSNINLLLPQGKKPMDAGSYINGYRIKAGTVLGEE